MSKDIAAVVHEDIQQNPRAKMQAICVEEMAELTVEITKKMRTERFNDKFEDHDWYTLLEEIADVQLSIYILLDLYGIDDAAFSKACNVKLDRVKERMLRQSMKKAILVGGES